MNKKITGLVIVIIIAIIAVSGCIGSGNSRVTEDEAIEIAKGQLNKKISNPEIFTNVTVKETNTFYEIIFSSSSTTDKYQVIVDSSNGKITSSSFLCNLNDDMD